MRKPKVLILTTNYGNGHVQVARALEERMVFENTANVVVRDIYQETNPRLHEWTKNLYLKSYTKSGRQLYRLFYYSSQGIAKRKKLTIFSYGYSKLTKIIADEQPDAIINTFPSFAVQSFLLKTNKTIPAYNVVTDYCLHHSWVQPEIDKFYVATEQLKTQLIKNRIDKDKINVTGIPVQHQFQKPFCRQSLFEKYKLNADRKTILIVAGAYGVSKEIKYICEGLTKNKHLQIVVVCGKNTELSDQLKLKFKQDHAIRIFGYVTEMAELFELATCVITKPGGIILSEAVVKNVPIMLTGATPGQERENALYFQEIGAAVLHDKWEDLVEDTQKLIFDDQRLIEMKAALSKIYVPFSTDTIINDVLQTYYWRHAEKKIGRV